VGVLDEEGCPRRGDAPLQHLHPGPQRTPARRPPGQAAPPTLQATDEKGTTAFAQHGCDPRCRPAPPPRRHEPARTRVLQAERWHDRTSGWKTLCARRRAMQSIKCWWHKDLWPKPFVAPSAGATHPVRQVRPPQDSPERVEGGCEPLTPCPREAR